MAVQWYPGHMHKARKQIKLAMPQVDLVIEVLDARIPYSSENPVIDELRGNRPCIKILNKCDLADPVMTKRWAEYFESEQGVKVLPLSADQKGQGQRVMDLCRKLGKKNFPERKFAIKPLRLMILGIPNVGKSTLINALAGRTIARVGNEPAVTKNQQRISLDSGLVLSDTPGILWPRMDDVNNGYRLAITGAIRNTAMQFEDVALYAAGAMKALYPEGVKARYKLNELPESDQELLEIIGRKRGGLRAGGRIDMNKASEVLLHDIRAGALGRVTLETPEMIPEPVIESAPELENP